jgi:hypothetical protein
MNDIIDRYEACQALEQLFARWPDLMDHAVDLIVREHLSRGPWEVRYDPEGEPVLYRDRFVPTTEPLLVRFPWGDHSAKERAAQRAAAVLNMPRRTK